MKLKLYILVWFTALGMMFSCHTTQKETENVQYTCPMHPQIKENAPGICPICHMDLVKLSVQKGDDAAIHLSDRQIELAHIQVDTIKDGTVENEMVFNGVLNFDPSNRSAVSARISGRIEQMFVKTVGDFVPKGAPILELYSEELNAAKKEYMLISKQLRLVSGVNETQIKAIKDAAEHKLELWGMNEKEIRALENSSVFPLRTVIYSTQSGYVSAVNVQEGAYVMEGATILEMIQLHTLWAEAQVFTSQASQIQLNDDAVIQVPELQLPEIKGKISFENPEIPTNSRINALRVVIPNPNGALKVGMPVYIFIRKPSKNGIVIPRNALIRNRMGATVWLQKQKGVFENVVVQTGVEHDFGIEIVAGLHAGDVVVVSGAYLLNSEYVFQHGTDPMKGLHLTENEIITPKNKALKSVSELMKIYVKMQESLSADDASSAFEAAQTMKGYLKSHQNLFSKALEWKPLDEALQTFSPSEMKVQREHFKVISTHIYALLKTNGTSEIWYKQYCPMANAYWMSAQKNIMNPYYGAKMLTCGEVQETIR